MILLDGLLEVVSTDLMIVRLEKKTRNCGRNRVGSKEWMWGKLEKRRSVVRQNKNKLVEN